MLSYLRKPTRIVLLAAIAVSLVAASSIAAQRGGKGGGVGMKGKTGYSRPAQKGQMGIGQGRIGQSLDLTQEQRSRIQDIRQQHRLRVQEVMSSNLSADQKQARRSELRQDMLQQINQVLTPEQRQKLQQGMSQRRGKGFDGGKRSLGGQRQFRGQRMLDQLDLSAEQRERIAAIRQRTQTAVRDVKANTELSDRAKQDRIRVIRERSHQEVLSVLTPAQREKLQQMRPAPRQGGGMR